MILLRYAKGVFFLAMLICMAGCRVLHHMDQLKTMGEFARDKNDQQKIVNETDSHYEALLKVINSGNIKNYPDQAAVLTNFGPPIDRKKVRVEGNLQDQWLYRSAIPQKAKDKIYLYFDSHGTLIKFVQEKIQWS